MKALVTGGAGFIGSHLIEELLKQKADITVLDNFTTGKQKNIPISDRINVIKGTIIDRKLLAKVMRDIDYVFHEAAITSVAYSMKHPATTWDVNIKGTKLLLNAAVTAGVKRVIFASSAAVYGNAIPPLKEKVNVKPISPYGNSKRMGEMLMDNYAKKEGLETVSLRYFNVYGPRQNPESDYSGVITRFISKLLHGKKPTVYGTGMQTRDFVYVKDVAKANILAAKIKKAKGEKYNIATGNAISILDLLREMNGILGKKLQPVFSKARVGDIKFSVADTKLSSKKLGFKATTKLKKGLEETIEWHRS